MTAKLLVTLLGLVAIASVLWYFLVPPKAAAPGGRASGGEREADVLVKGAYRPDVIAARAGERIKLKFYRDETADRSERVIFETLGISRALPAYRTTTIELGPLEAGEYPFHCAMNMLRGRLVVRAE